MLGLQSQNPAQGYQPTQLRQARQAVRKRQSVSIQTLDLLKENQWLTGQAPLLKLLKFQRSVPLFIKHQKYIKKRQPQPRINMKHRTSQYRGLILLPMCPRRQKFNCPQIYQQVRKPIKILDSGHKPISRLQIPLRWTGKISLLSVTPVHLSSKADLPGLAVLSDFPIHRKRQFRVMYLQNYLSIDHPISHLGHQISIRWLPVVLALKSNRASHRR